MTGRMVLSGHASRLGATIHTIKKRAAGARAWHAEAPAGAMLFGPQVWCVPLPRDEVNVPGGLTAHEPSGRPCHPASHAQSEAAVEANEIVVASVGHGRQLVAVEALKG